MPRKIVCENSSCKHWCHDNYCDTVVKINAGGKCASFEKGIIYYFHLIWDVLDGKNFIDAVEIIQNPDIRIGLYYVMDCYDLGFSEMEWGTCRIVALKDGEAGAPLTYQEIVKRDLNMEKLQKHMEDFNNGILPGHNKKPGKAIERKEFGWLSPTGVFTESPFGEHEESAMRICREKGFESEYRKWSETGRDTPSRRLYRDFLAAEKGYCLIHNPAGIGGYIVTHTKDLTKTQKDFLYGYFIDMGDRFKAEQFLKE